jgi:hypothetical protein
LEDLEKVTNAFNKVIRGDTETIDVALHKKNGEEAVINVTSVPIIIGGMVTGSYNGRNVVVSYG